MLKISQTGTPNHSVTLKLEGRVVGLWVEELRHICAALMQNGCSLELDLAGVSYVDESGLELLANLQRRTVKLTQLSPFLSELLKAIPVEGTSLNSPVGRRRGCN